jgi:hypothetical protein
MLGLAEDSDDILRRARVYLTKPEKLQTLDASLRLTLLYNRKG